MNKMIRIGVVAAVALAGAGATTMAHAGINTLTTPAAAGEATPGDHGGGGPTPGSTVVVTLTPGVYDITGDATGRLTLRLGGESAVRQADLDSGGSHYVGVFTSSTVTFTQGPGLGGQTTGEWRFDLPGADPYRADAFTCQAGSCTRVGQIVARPA